MKFILVLILLLVIPSLPRGELVEPLHAAVAFDNASTAVSTGGTSLTWSHTVSAAGDNFLACGMSGEGGSSGEVTGITYNTVAMTLKTRYYGALDPGPGLELFEQAGVSGPGTAHNVVLTNADAGVSYVGWCMSFTGVHQTTPSGSPVSNATDPLDSGSVTVPTNGMAYEVANWGFGSVACETATAQASGQTKQFQNCSSGNNIIGFGSTRTTTGNFTWNGSTTSHETSVAVPLNEAAVTVGVARRRIINP
jgi:hypothetical protein